ncbi:MAG: 4-hydroxy-2-oxovalerate aldolase, partial [Acidimicrobiia bacterium]
RRKAVGGQEDMIIDVALELSRQPGARGGPEDAAAAAARS